jgi:deazaflavin-dependent oxidoreductase (nitroreductase family)
MATCDALRKWDSVSGVLHRVPTKAANFAIRMKREALVARPSIQSIVDKQVLHLTTTGRRTGLPREIEIWFVVCHERFYLFAERGEAAKWVKNIRHNPKVTVRIGECQIDGTARVLDSQADCKLWGQVAALADHKYGWGEGVPVEITPLPYPDPFPGH